VPKTALELTVPVPKTDWLENWLDVWDTVEEGLPAKIVDGDALFEARIGEVEKKTLDGEVVNVAACFKDSDASALKVPV